MTQTEHETAMLQAELMVNYLYLTIDEDSMDLVFSEEYELDRKRIMRMISKLREIEKRYNKVLRYNE